MARRGKLTGAIWVSGTDEVLKNLNAEIKAIRGRTQGGVTKAALKVKGRSQDLPPVVEGNLRASAFVTSPNATTLPGSGFKGPEGPKVRSDTQDAISDAKGDLRFEDDPVAAIGYGAKYALDVHENQAKQRRREQRAGTPTTKTDRASRVGQWKYLETALKELSGRVLEIIREKASIR